ncbi:serine hydrolase [Streptomyces sp. NPDC048387]|uniref:serine hydrolase n=1 Tax=Streptomyces sp. NPDC048387 TaxID=3365542 RepID=UPI003721C191
MANGEEPLALAGSERADTDGPAGGNSSSGPQPKPGPGTNPTAKPDPRMPSAGQPAAEPKPGATAPTGNSATEHRSNSQPPTADRLPDTQPGPDADADPARKPDADADPAEKPDADDHPAPADKPTQADTQPDTDADPARKPDADADPAEKPDADGNPAEKPDADDHPAPADKPTQADTQPDTDADPAGKADSDGTPGSQPVGSDGPGAQQPAEAQPDAGERAGEPDTDDPDEAGPADPDAVKTDAQADTSGPEAPAEPEAPGVDAAPRAGSAPEDEAAGRARPGDGAAAGTGSPKGEASVRRPSWAGRDGEAGEESGPPAAGEPLADDDAASTLTLRKEQPAAPLRRPSWAKDKDERNQNEEDLDGDGGTAGRQSGVPAPAEGARAGATTAGADGGAGDRPRTEPASPASQVEAAEVPKAAARTSAHTPARRDPVGVAGPGPVVLERTRETPRPPLELLAELTNSPPPAETLRRALVRRVTVWAAVGLVLGGVAVGAQMLRPLPEPRLVASQDSFTLDGTTTLPWPAQGQAAVRIPGSGDIGTFGEQKPVPTASVGKVMTAYVILKNHPLRKGDPGPRIEVDAEAAAGGRSENESRIQTLTVGQKFSEQDMLKMMMIPSANNVARLLARWDSGSEAAFLAKMNAAAQELGMRDTRYTDPSGLDSGTVSTAVDQLRLAEAVMRDEVFRAIVATPGATIEGLPESLVNNNSLLSVRGLSNVGIKTGSSTPAGGTLMWAAYKTVGGETPLILGTMMDQHVKGPDPDARNSLALVLDNSRKVIEAVRAALAAAPVIHKGQTVGYVSDGLGGRTPLVATKDLTVIGVPGQRLRASLGTAGGKPVPHEAGAGTEVGVLTVGEGAGARTVPVAVGERLTGPSFGTRVTRLS